MSNSLGTTIDQAQAAFSNGDYRSVVESCTHIIDQFPHYTAAQRLLGLAYLEQGQAGEAETLFARLLAHDPRDPSAYLGLGLIAEDRGVLDHALAYCQVAWELAPNDTSFRDPINRVAEKRYGNEGRLRLTHAALARMHANSSRMRRAIKEYQAALIALPDRIDLWMGLAETLWILGETADAAEIAREFLKDHSELVPALVILADLEHRGGNAGEAEEYRDRLRRLDPDGTLAAAMVAKHPSAAADFLLLKPEEQPQLAERADAVVINERPQFAPAPDFSFQSEHDDGTVADFDDLQPIRLEEFADDLPEIPSEPTASSFMPESIGEDEEEPDTVEVEPLSSETADVTEDDLEQVFDEASAPADEPEQEGISGINLFDMDLDDGTPPFSDDPVDEAELESLLDDFEGIEPMSLDDFGASDEMPAGASSGFFEDSDIDFDIRIEDPDAVQIGGGPPKVAPNVFSGGLFQDSSSIDDEFPELPVVDEPGEDVQVDEDDEAERGTVLLSQADQLETSEEELVETEESDAPSASPDASPPIVQSGTGFTRLLGELGNEGLAPFDPMRTAGQSAPQADESSDDDGPAFPSLADGWDEIDAQLASATPGGDPGSDDLLDGDDFGLEPFALDDDEMDFVTSVEPAGRSRPESAPEDHAESAASGDDSDRSEEASVQAAEPDPGTVGDMDDVPGLEPFAIEDFAEVGGTDTFDFGVLPWEQQEQADGDSIDVQELLAEATEPDADEEEEPPFDPELPTSAAEHLDINQELSNGVLDPHFARRMAEVEQAARENLDRLHRDEGRDPDEAVAASDVGSVSSDINEPHENVVTPTAIGLVTDAELFDRTRLAKTSLIGQGIIKGDREFAAAPVEDEPAVEEPVAVSEPETPFFEPKAETDEVELDAPEMEHTDQDAAADSPDLEVLRQTIENDPRDDDARWQYAEALREQGEIHAAFTEYRWLIRHAPGRHNAIIASLELCAYQDQEADLAHRLLADIYRRRGDSSQARNHASMAMATRRLMREIKM